MTKTYEDTATIVIETMIQEAKDHVARADTESGGRGRAMINAGIAQAKAFIAIATVLQEWNRDGVPILALGEK
jgi:hypothetical protein